MLRMPVLPACRERHGRQRWTAAREVEFEAREDVRVKTV